MCVHFDFICFVVLAQTQVHAGEALPTGLHSQLQYFHFYYGKKMVLQGLCLKLWAMFSKLRVWRAMGFPDLIQGQIFSTKGKKILTVWNNPGEKLVEYRKKEM